MSEPPRGHAFRLAEEKNVKALKLIKRGKLYPALDLLNEAIRHSPEYAPSFVNRAEVFAQLGMVEQARADLRRAEALPTVNLAAHASRSIPMEQTAEPAPSSEARSRPMRLPAPAQPSQATRTPGTPQPPETVRRTQSVGPTEPGRSAEPRLETARARAPRSGKVDGSPLRLWPVLAAVAVAGITALILFLILGSGGSGDTEARTDFGPRSVHSSPAPTDDSTPTEAASGPGIGRPLTLATLERAWDGAGLSVSSAGPTSGLSGFSVEGRDVKLSRGSETLSLSVLVYKTPDDVKEDWDLEAGQGPQLKADHTIGNKVSQWWNQNVIIIVRSGSGKISSDALQAFLSLTP